MALKPFRHLLGDEFDRDVSVLLLREAEGQKPMMIM